MNDAPSTVMHPEPLPGIFLWGAKRSGKSGFAGSLYALGRARDGGARWTTHPKDALDQHSASQLDQAYLGLMQRDHPATNPRLPSPLRFVARRRGKA